MKFTKIKPILTFPEPVSLSNIRIKILQTDFIQNDFWLASGCATSQLNARLENHCITSIRGP